MSDDRPSLFQRSKVDPGGFELTGGYLTITGEARRQQLEYAIREVLDHFGLQVVELAEPVRYIPDYSRDMAYVDSIVKVVLAVPESIDPSGHVKFEINVPPFLDWGKQVLQIVINFVVDWCQGQTS